MGKQQSTKHYNLIYEAYEPSEERTGLYEMALSLLPNDCGPILEIGCGAGEFAELLVQNNLHKNYLGIDSSKAAIGLSRKRCPYVRFECLNVFKMESRILNMYRVFVLLEVLEHLNKDIALLDLLNPGSLIIFSVPNANFISHVRHFESHDGVVKRYNDKLKFDEQLTFVNERKQHRKAFLFRAYVRN